MSANHELINIYLGSQSLTVCFYNKEWKGFLYLMLLEKKKSPEQ